MTRPPLNALVPSTPLLDLTVVPGAALEAVADPFPVSHHGRLYVLAEVLGRRAASGLFKKIGVFEVSENLQGVEWLGEACPDDEGLCSFPFVVRDGDGYILTPEVFVPMQGGGPAILQTLQIWRTSERDFPFGWRKHHEGRLPGCAAPSDKVLMRREEGSWRLFCSDNAMRRLLAYDSDDLRTWRPVPGDPVARGDAADGPASPGRRPWRLGGGPLVVDGVPALPLQHDHEGLGYGGAVTLLSLPDGASGAVARLAPAPLLAADSSREWMSRGAHHVAMVRHRGRRLVAVDGFDGRSWRSTVMEAGSLSGMEPLP